MALYAPTAEEVKESFKQRERMDLYLAFTRFISTDTSPNDPALFDKGEPISNNARQRLFKLRAIEDIRRSDALNRMLAEKLVKEQGYIRLSIREQSDTPEKIGVNLLAGNDGEFVASPWHSVIAIKKDGTYQAMKKVEAEIAGYEVVMKDGRPHHYVEK